jgi:uncharacterized protein YecE (DUF72 family)
MPDDQLGFDFAQEGDPEGSSNEAAAGELLPGIRPLAERVQRLARRGIYLGTSSWKYPGWLGRVYTPGRYATRRAFSEKKFNDTCLAEYAQVFPAVGGDFSFYQFPSEAYWKRLMDQVPSGFRFGLKVPEEITVQRWPKLRRYGQRAGRTNEGFLDAVLLADRFLEPLWPHRDKVGVIMFEFGTVHRGPLSEPAGFVTELDRLLGKLPTDEFRFAVEIRNPNFLGEGDGGGAGDTGGEGGSGRNAGGSNSCEAASDSSYLDCLRSHGVAHVMNSWTRMPPLDEQLALPGALTANHVATRLLLRPGRTYQQAVDQFAPYERAQEVYDEGRAALGELIEQCLAEQRMLFAFVNNRFEGNAVDTIEGILAGLNELDDG